MCQIGCCGRAGDISTATRHDTPISGQKVAVRLLPLWDFLIRQQAF